MSVKLVFWDWMGTLFCNNILYRSRLSNLIEKKTLKQNIDFDQLSFSDSLIVKSHLKKYPLLKNPFAFWLVDQFTFLDIFQVIISNGFSSDIIKKLGDYNPFDLILTSESFNPKPDTSMLLHAMDVLSINSTDDVIFIGDSLTDKNTASKLNIKFFHITDPFSSFYFIAKDLSLI